MDFRKDWLQFKKDVEMGKIKLTSEIKALKNLLGVRNKEILLLDIRKTQITKILTPKRMELLCILSKEKPKSIQELSRKTGRGFSIVYRDLQLLKKYGIIQFTKKNKKVVPELKTSDIIIHTSPLD